MRISDCSADVCSSDLILDLILRESLDGIRDMGDYLNRRAEIVATPFTGDDRLINAASGDIVGLARGNTSEAFIMTKIKVGFRPVVSHINFTMLIRSEEHTSELQSLMRLSYAVFFLKKKQYQPQY